jgi:hypothetical protein
MSMQVCSASTFPSVVTTIRSLPVDKLQRAFHGVSATEHILLPVPNAPLLPSVRNIFQFGDRLHRAFTKYYQTGDCRPIFKPYAETLTHWLTGVGAGRLMTNWNYWARDGMPTGTLDALMVGNGGRRGVLEIKTTEGSGTTPRPAHLCQVGGYLNLQSNWDRTRMQDQWAILAYACPREQRWHVHMYLDVSGVIGPAETLLAA